MSGSGADGSNEEVGPSVEHDVAALVDRLRALAMRAGRDGEALPGEPALARALGVSRPALREGMVRLEAEGLIRRRKGAGTVVNPGACDVLARFDHQVPFADLLRDAGFEPALEVLESQVVTLGDLDARLLGRRRGEPALRTVKRWRADGRPVMVAVDVVATFGEEARLEGIDPGRSVFDIVTALTGDDVAWELAWPGAQTVRGPVRAWLEAASPAVLTLDLIGVGRQGARVYHALEYHVPGVVPWGFIRSVRS